MDKFSSTVLRVHMELGGKLFYSLRIKTQFLKRLLQGVSVVDGATHTQKDDVESNGGSLENVAEAFALFLCGVQLVLRSGILLTIIDLDEVDFTPRFAEVYGSVLRSMGRCCLGLLVALLVAGGAAGMLPVSLNCPLHATSKNPPTPCSSLLFLYHSSFLSVLPFSFSVIYFLGPHNCSFFKRFSV